jgi:hypothetical protein
MGKLSSFATDFANSSLKTHPLTVPTTPLKKSSKKSGISVPEWLGKSVELADKLGINVGKIKIKLSVRQIIRNRHCFGFDLSMNIPPKK